MDARWTKARDRQDRRMRRSQPSQPALRSEKRRSDTGPSRSVPPETLKSHIASWGGTRIRDKRIDSPLRHLATVPDISRKRLRSTDFRQSHHSTPCSVAGQLWTHSRHMRDTPRIPKLCLRFHRSLLMRGAEKIQAVDSLAASPRGAVPGSAGSFLSVSETAHLPGPSLRD